MKAVIDTNILVSALWKPMGNAYSILVNVIAGKIMPCYDSRMMEEYREVLLRPKFRFTAAQVDDLLTIFKMNGISVIPTPILVSMEDEDDRPFYEVAKYCNVPLITGNIRHFPTDELIMTPADFCRTYLIA